jgi:hypothetical protein
MQKLMIGTPMYGGMCSAYYTFSNLNLLRSAASRNLEISYQFTTSESLITRARTGIANTFLNSDCSHLLYIDADIGFEPESVFKLLDHNLDFVCAGYPAKNIDWNHIEKAVRNGMPAHTLPSFASPYIYNRLEVQHDVPPGLIEVKNAGTGFMMIAKSVLLKMSNHVPSYINNQFDNHGHRHKEFFSTSIKHDILLSEDHYFCEKWRELGGRIFIDPSIRLKHIGNYVFESSPNHWIS